MTLAKARVHQIGVVTPGFAFKSKDLSESGIPVVKIGSITDGGTVDLESGQFLSEALIEDRHAKFFLQDGDIILGMTGEGKIGRIRNGERSLLNQRVCRITPFDIQNQDYLWAALRTIDYAKIFAQLAQGAAQANIRGRQIEALEIPWPESYHRQRIGDLFACYDDIIDKNKRRIVLLENAARLLYREWFVHYRFPGHEHKKITDGHPVGWRTSPVSDLAKIVRGKSYRSSELVESDGQPFVNLKCIDRFGGFRTSGLKRFRGEHMDHHVVRPGDVVIAVTDMTREAMIISQAARVPTMVGDEAIFSMDLVKAVPRVDVDPEWFYGMLRFSQFSSVVREEATGATVLHLKPKHIESWEMVVPPTGLRQLFAEQFRTILQQVDNLELQNERYVKARNLLLPCVMNGQIAL